MASDNRLFDYPMNVLEMIIKFEKDFPRNI